MRPFRLLITLGLLATLSFVGCADGDQSPAEAEETTEPTDETQPTSTILTEAENAGLTTFRTAVAQANLDDVLGGPGPYTVFAPSDEAFNALPEGTLESLLDEGNRDELQQLITYHILPRRVLSGDLSGEISATSVEGQNLTLRATDGAVTVSDAQGDSATVTTADIEADNGVIHVIDSVLMPAEEDEAGMNTNEGDTQEEDDATDI